MFYRISTCNCCNRKAVPCAVMPAGVLPEFSTCRDCDKAGLILKLSTYRKA